LKTTARFSESLSPSKRPDFCEKKARSVRARGEMNERTNMLNLKRSVALNRDGRKMLIQVGHHDDDHDGRSFAQARFLDSSHLLHPVGHCTTSLVHADPASHLMSSTPGAVVWEYNLRDSGWDELINCDLLDFIPCKVCYSTKGNLV